MNLRDVEYLVALADHGTYAAAASACGVSQPTLSVQIRKLEEEVGAELVTRSGRATVFTPTGHAVLAHARDVLRAVAGIRSVTAAAANVVRIGVFPTLAQYLLPHITAGLQRDLAGVEIHWTERKTGKLLALLDDGVIDAALLASPELVPTGLEQHHVFDERFVLAAPAHHALGSGTGRASVAELDDQQLVLLDDGHCLRDHVLSLCPAGPRDREIRAHSLETLRHMVAAGVGVTLLPALAVLPPAPTPPGVVLREFTDPAPVRRIALVARPGADTETLGRIRDSIRAHVEPVLRAA